MPGGVGHDMERPMGSVRPFLEGSLKQPCSKALAAFSLKQSANDGDAPFEHGKKCTAEENGRDENGRERRESLEGDSRSAVEIKNRTYGHQHISINEFSGYRVYFRSGPATGVAANYNRFQQNDLPIL
ncbi:hypothetical protein WN51_13249 [Melipona quadrifasciata]|uniref:Uncharacterized protein n=1 Tax=Melipona quadrifasciata TaxID=166423 RepID=A0A0N0U5K3_9HYME|nr:hypothetical protein WN51_13249 [Melipona quadrifasciata]